MIVYPTCAIIEMRPFCFGFTCERILSWWCNILGGQGGHRNRIERFYQAPWLVGHVMRADEIAGQKKVVLH